MVDGLIVALTSLKTKPLDSKYKPHQAIRGQKLVNQKSDRLAVIFPWWYASGSLFYRFLVWRLSKKGWAVLAYEFHSQVLQADEKVVLESYKHIRQQIAWELELLTKKHGYNQVHFIGLSLGTIPLTLVADKFPAFTSATIVTGGDDLAVDMWHSLSTVNIKQSFEHNHIPLKRLDEDWQPVDPQNHVTPFAHKKVYFFMSLKDKLILTKYQKRLAAALEDVQARIIVKKRRVGHTMTIVLFCLAGSPF